MNEKFLELIEGLSRLMNLPLIPDQNKSVILLLDHKIRVQIEVDPVEDRIHIASQIEELSPGKFRENVLLHALIENVYPYILTGTLAYSDKTGSLVLFHTFELDRITPDKLFAFLPRFVDKTADWQEALKAAAPAPASVLERIKKIGTNPFNLT